MKELISRVSGSSIGPVGAGGAGVSEGCSGSIVAEGTSVSAAIGSTVVGVTGAADSVFPAIGEAGTGVGASGVVDRQAMEVRKMIMRRRQKGF